MASQRVLLPLIFMAGAICSCFVMGTAPVTRTLRGPRQAVPEALEMGSSINAALEVSTPGWWANIVTVVVPCTILIIIYLQSEKRKYEEAMRK
eukprot:Skav226923  [mRNA]  locus=scaffold3728:68478:71600:- [translate_table: standard]